MGAIIIKWSQKDVTWHPKIIKIEEMYMFYHLNPWQSWQVGPFSFIRMLKNSTKKFIW